MLESLKPVRQNVSEGFCEGIYVSDTLTTYFEDQEVPELPHFHELPSTRLLVPGRAHKYPFPSPKQNEEFCIFI